MSDITKAAEEIQEKTRELKEIAAEVEQEKDEAKKLPLLQRLEKLEEDLGIIIIKWKGFQQDVAKEYEEKKQRQETHKKAEEEARARKNKGWYE